MSPINARKWKIDLQGWYAQFFLKIEKAGATNDLSSAHMYISVYQKLYLFYFCPNTLSRITRAKQQINTHKKDKTLRFSRQINIIKLVYSENLLQSNHTYQKACQKFNVKLWLQFLLIWGVLSNAKIYFCR
jgi:hypothetical protein